jgi:hypothetical protein
MAKRFTDTEKWNKKFYRELSNDYKLLWIYLLDHCNHAGIWDVDLDHVEYRLKTVFDEKKVLEIFGKRIHSFHEGEKWFIIPFIEFQYKELNPQVKAHYSVIDILRKYNLEKYLDDFTF